MGSYQDQHVLKVQRDVRPGGGRSDIERSEVFS